MAGPVAEQRIRAPMARMRRETVSFLHWPYDPRVVAPLVPAGLELDLAQGQAWVGLVSFFMAGVRPLGVPPLPGLSTFPEINVRTYVRTPDGLDGLLFLTLEASRLAMTVADPLIGIGYRWADMAIHRDRDAVTYRTRRRWPPQPAATSVHRVAVGEPIVQPEQTRFDHYLTGRWRAYSRRRGGLFCTPVEHEPWPLHRASLIDIDDGLIASCGLPAPAGEPIAHYAPGVDVRLGFPRRVSPR